MQLGSETRQTEAKPRRRWLQFRLRTLILFIGLCAVLLALWQMQARLCLLALRSPPLAKAAWARLLRLNGMSAFASTTEPPVDFWPQNDVGLTTAWEWVRQGDRLWYVTPQGRVSGFITVGDATPQLLWKGMLTNNNRPGIAVLSGEVRGKRWLVCASVTKEDPRPIVRLLVRVDDAGATCRLVSDSPSPQFEVRSSDGRFVETFPFEEMPRGTPQSQPPGPKPWKVVMRQ